MYFRESKTNNFVNCYIDENFMVWTGCLAELKLFLNDIIIVQSILQK